MTFDTFESDFDTVLGAYTGSAVNALTETARNDDDNVSGSSQSRISFEAVAGTTYYIAVDGFSGATGQIVLNYYRGRVPVAGTYFGLIESELNSPATSAYSHSESGFIRMTVTTTGKFTAAISYAGQTASLRGTFGDKVTISGEKQIPGHGIIDVTISGETDRIVGTVQDNGATAIIEAHRNVFNRRTNPAPQAGRYTLMTRPTAPFVGQEEFPQGFGHGSIIVKTGGTLRVAATLGDGTQINVGSALSQSGTMPLYAALYKKQGSVQGLAAFDEIENQSDGNGTLNWLKRARDSDSFYPSGFTTQLDLIVSKFLAPDRGEPILEFPDSIGSLRVELSDGGGAAIPPFEVTLDRGNHVTGDGGVSFKIKIKRKTGAFKGSFRDPSTFKRRKFSGSIFQKQQVGNGLFKGDGETGSVLLESTTTVIAPAGSSFEPEPILPR